MSQQQATTVQGMLERMSDTDKDFRFMATNDLMSELQHENVHFDDEAELKITQKIISLIKDKNCEVQNLSVKCLKSLIGKIKIDRIELVISELCLMMQNNSEQVRDISTIALKSIIPELPINERIVAIINQCLNPSLMRAISLSNDLNIRLECLDILTELINLMSEQISESHQAIQVLLFTQLQCNKSAIQKRSINCIAQLMISCSAELYIASINQLMDNLTVLCSKPIEEFGDTTSVTSIGTKIYLQCLASVIRITGHRSDAEHVERIVPLVKNFVAIEDDETREYCLQVFEALVRRCPIHITNYLEDIIRICSTYLSYDPNYNYDEDNEYEDMEMDDGAEDDVDESSDDYSDDDDISWKVRRASAKCLETVITSRADMVNDFFVTIAPILISRFKEREENVKADIIQTFIALLKQTKKLVVEYVDINASSQAALIHLNKLIPTIITKSAGQLREKGVRTRQSIFTMFIDVMNVFPNALSSNISALVPGILYSLADKNSTSSMKISALLFVKEMLKTHEPAIIHPHINAILPSIINAVGDSFYKIATEALVLLTQIIKILRPFEVHHEIPSNESSFIVRSIYERIIERMSKTDIDLEIKERAISCLGQIIASFGDYLHELLPRALPALLDKLSAETTRLVGVKSLITITSSPIHVDMKEVFPQAYTILATFLRKNSRPLRVSTLILIETSVRRSAHLIDESHIDIILKETSSLVSENDLYLSQLALNMIATLIKTQKAFLPILPQTILPETLQLIRSPLLQGTALESMLNFLSTLVKSNFPGLEHNSLISKLLEPIYKEVNVHKQAYYSTAKSIAAISVSDLTCSRNTVAQLVTDIQRYNENENIQMLILLSIGEIGKMVDLADVNGLMEVILQAFNSTCEDVKSAGSYALGSIAIGNLDRFLPYILQEIEVRNKRQYLLLHSLREFISIGLVNNVVIDQQLNSIWILLMKLCDCYEEGTRNVVSECLGKLTLLRPDELLPRLLRSLKEEFSFKPTARATLITAVKFTICDKPHSIDHLLKKCMSELLAALKDDDNNVRRVVLVMLNSAAHNKPSLIRDLLPELLPLLYQETYVKSELIRQVQMGPFKHRVDDGLDSRKTAFECMYTLLDSCQGQLNIYEFLTHVENGMKDHNDIKMLTYLMLSRLATLYPSAVLQRIDRLVAPLEDVCRLTVKENAVKQEHERLDELKRSALRAFDFLTTIPDAIRHPVILRFKHSVISSNKNLAQMYSNVHKDATTNGNGTITRMDIG